MKRIFLKNGGITDVTLALDNYYSGSSSISTADAEIYLYIGDDVPFNSFYVKMATASATPALLSVSYWDGKSWVAAVETIDETLGYSQSGFVTFTPEKGEEWERSSTNYQNEQVTGLESFNVYDKYWIRVGINTTVLDCSFAWVGSLFADDNDLGSEFPDLVRSNVLTSFKTGKTNWEEQHMKAAQVMEQDLVNMGTITAAGNILKRTDYKNAAIYKCAEIIYRSFGNDYVDLANAARDEYMKRLNKRLHTVDKNNNALEDIHEKNATHAFMSR